MTFLNSQYLFQYYNYAIYDMFLYLFLFRALGEVDSGDVSMYCNPAYVAMESYHQSRPEEATDESFHQPLFPGTLRKGLVHHVYTTCIPLQGAVPSLTLPYVSLILMVYICTYVLYSLLDIHTVTPHLIRLPCSRRPSTARQSCLQSS